MGFRVVEYSAAKIGMTAMLVALPGCVEGLFGVPTEPDPVIERPECATGAALGETTVSYAEDLVPIMMRVGCLANACHGGSNPSVGFSLATYARMFEPGSGATLNGACPVVPGDPGASYIIEKLGVSPRTGRQMPDRRPPLREEELQLFVNWILEGAANN